jgi:TolA-binding protein
MKKFLISVAVAALAAPMFAQTTPARVAVIDVTVLTQSTSAAAYEKLKKMQDERMERAKAMDEELKKLNADIEIKRLRSARTSSPRCRRTSPTEVSSCSATRRTRSARSVKRATAS